MKKLYLILGLLNSFVALAMQPENVQGQSVTGKLGELIRIAGEKPPIEGKDKVEWLNKYSKLFEEQKKESIQTNAKSDKEIDLNPNIKYFLYGDKLFPFNFKDIEAFTQSTFKELLKDSKWPALGVAVVFSGNGRYVNFYSLNEYYKYIGTKDKSRARLFWGEYGVANPTNRQPIDLSFMIFVNDKDKYYKAVPFSISQEGRIVFNSNLIGPEDAWIILAEKALRFARDNFDQKLQMISLSQKFLSAIFEKAKKGKINERLTNRASKAQKKLNELLKKLKPEISYNQQLLQDIPKE